MIKSLLAISTLTFSTFASAIIGGSFVPGNSPLAASTVGIVIQTYEGTGTCTGSLISKNLVITAAHCVTDKQKRLLPTNSFTVTFGTSMHAPVRTIPAAGIAVNRDYNGLNTIDASDVALIYINQELPQGYRPAKLLRMEDDVDAGDSVILVGYGVTNGFNDTGAGTLKRADVRVMDWLGGTEIILDQRYGQGACRGDSGGPGFVQRGSEYYLFGVTSRGAKLCNDRGIYTSIAAFADFIPEARARLYAQAGLTERHNFETLDNIYNLTFGANVDQIANKAWSGNCYEASNPNVGVKAGLFIRLKPRNTGAEMTDYWDGAGAGFAGQRFSDIQARLGLSFYDLEYPTYELESSRSNPNYYRIRQSGQHVVAELKNSQTNALVARCLYTQAVQ